MFAVVEERSDGKVVSPCSSTEEKKNLFPKETGAKK